VTQRLDFVDDLMLDAMESSSVTFWEVAGLASTAFPDLGPKGAQEFAEDVIRDLLARGWLEILSQTAEDFEAAPLRPEPVDSTRIPGALQDEMQWSREKIGESLTRYFIHATSRGRQELQASLRERGLYRDGPGAKPTS